MLDKQVFTIIAQEEERQRNNINLIASENIASNQVRMAVGSVLCNKYAEGYSNKRYYGGCKNVDLIEDLAIERAKKLFNCQFANVQPHSGAQANLSVFAALLHPQDTILGMDLSAGGHLTHGCKVTISGKWFNAIGYGLNKNELIDYDQVRELAIKHQPKLIIAGASAYSRIIDWQIFREIAHSVGAYLMVDMAHIAGLVATNLHPSPLPYADVVTSTTHKTLRGARGGLILTNHENIFKKIQSGVFPASQGGPLMNNIAGKAVAFWEALQTDFTTYMEKVITNSKLMANYFMENNIRVVSQGTDNHLFLLDLTGYDTGKNVQEKLEQIGIICNKNSIPFDPLPPTQSSGIRIGTPFMTSFGFTEVDFLELAKIIESVIKNKFNKNA